MDVALCIATPAFRAWTMPKMTGSEWLNLQRNYRSQVFSELQNSDCHPLEVQQEIVAEIEAEQALVDGNRELIERFEKKIRDAVGRVWGEGE